MTKFLRESNIEEEITYVFELGDRGQGTVRVAFEEIFSHESSRRQYMVHGFAFKPKQKTPGLQAADVSAFETGRYVPRMLASDPPPPRKCFERLLGALPHTGILFDAKRLAGLVAARRQG